MLRMAGAQAPAAAAGPEGAGLRVASWRFRVEHVIRHRAEVRPDLRARRVEAGSAEADLQVETFLEEPPLAQAGLAPAAGAIPLDALARLRPAAFGDRLARFSLRDRPYWRPWPAVPRCVVYNAELLQGAGLVAPCRLELGRLHFVLPPTPGAVHGDLVPFGAEQLGASPENLEPVRAALALVQDLNRTAGACSADDRGDNWGRTFYPGQAALMTMASGNPYGASPSRRTAPGRSAEGSPPGRASAAATRPFPCGTARPARSAARARMRCRLRRPGRGGGRAARGPHRGPRRPASCRTSCSWPRTVVWAWPSSPMRSWIIRRSGRRWRPAGR